MLRAPFFGKCSNDNFVIFIYRDTPVKRDSEKRKNDYILTKMGILGWRRYWTHLSPLAPKRGVSSKSGVVVTVR